MSLGVSPGIISPFYITILFVKMNKTSWTNITNIELIKGIGSLTRNEIPDRGRLDTVDTVHLKIKTIQLLLLKNLYSEMQNNKVCNVYALNFENIFMWVFLNISRERKNQ